MRRYICSISIGFDCLLGQVGAEGVEEPVIASVGGRSKLIGVGSIDFGCKLPDLKLAHFGQ